MNACGTLLVYNERLSVTPPVVLCQLMLVRYEMGVAWESQSAARDWYPLFASSQDRNVNMHKISSYLTCDQSATLSSTSIILILSTIHLHNHLLSPSLLLIMITTTFVGLGLTTLPRLLRVFGRPFRPDVPLASTFPAWVDADYGHIDFPNEVSRVHYFFHGCQ